MTISKGMAKELQVGTKEFRENPGESICGSKCF